MDVGGRKSVWRHNRRRELVLRDQERSQHAIRCHLKGALVNWPHCWQELSR